MDINMEDNKELITELLKGTKRKGIENLVKHMDEAGFFSSPCSGQYHLCEPGGLAEHSLNVYRYGLKLATTLMPTLSPESLTIVTLLHDLGKCGDFGKPNYTENILKSGKRSDSKPYETNKDLLYVPHEIRSIAIAERYIELAEEEEFAILMHNGLYGDLKYTYSGKETPLSLVLHWADMWCCRVVETEKESDSE